jgi:hypothetical protein
MRRILLALAAAGSTGLACAAAEFQYYVFPVAGITGISQSALKASSPSSRYGGMIQEKYADLFFDSSAQMGLITHFDKAVSRAFPSSVVGPNQVGTHREGKYAYQPYAAAQCSPAFKVNYRDTFAVAMGVSRLSTYFNSYSDFTQVLVPVTYTIRFVKLNGAAVIFSKSETVYTEYATTTKDFFIPGTQEMAPAVVEKLRSAIYSDGLAMIDRQTELAARNFSPKQTQVGISARDGGYFIFDRGSEIGFASGEDFDALNEQGEEFSFTVKYATDGLAVAQASDFSTDVKQATNRLREGAKLKFSFSRQGKDDAKPSVLAVSYASPNGTPLPQALVLENALQSIVVDDIGFKAPFNLIKQDADFVRLKEQIRGEANCESSMFQSMSGFSDNTTEPRVNPDFYLKFDQYASPMFRVDGTAGVTSKTIFSNAVTLSLVDRGGVIRQVFMGNSPYELVRTGGKGLAPEQATEVNLKNASLLALNALLTGFNPKRKVMTVNGLADKVATLSEPLPQAAFNQVQLARPLKVGNKTVYLPLHRSEAQLERASQDTDALAFKGSLRKGDVVLLGAFGSGHRVLRTCDASRQRRFLTAPLSHPSSGDALIARVVGSSLKGYDLLETNRVFLDSVAVALRDGMFESQTMAPAEDTPYCVLGMELQQLPRNECSSGKCSGTASVGSGIRLLDGTTKIGESVQAGRFEFSDVQTEAVSSFVGIKAFEQHLKSISPHQSKLP